MKKKSLCTKSVGSEPSELWAPCWGFEDFYEISTTGRIYKKPYPTRAMLNGVMYPREVAGKIITPYITKKGYYQIRLLQKHRTTTGRLHVLVARTFLGEPPVGKYWVGHHDGNILNNRLENLFWCSRTKKLGPSNIKMKLDEAKALEIFNRSRAGEYQLALAYEYGISESLVWSIKNKKAWRHIHG